MLPATTHIGSVTLVVRDLGRVLDFYEGALGFTRLKQNGPTVTLGASQNGPPLVVLEEKPQARPRPRTSPGLFHTAFLYPSRPDLARVLRRLVQLGTTFQGFADHLVSEALYLADPEGNGVELYADRPRETWTRVRDSVAMATEPLDLEGLMAELEPDDRWRGTPPDTSVGHVHLQVSDLHRAEEFWSGSSGFEVTTRAYPGALFVSAGGYHHHLGLNIWNSRGGVIPDGDVTGLSTFTVVLNDAGALADLGGRLAGQRSPGAVSARDPDGIGVEFRDRA